ncbi:glycosyltransferase family 2 protein [Sphingobacterium multivorum]|uniref:glycosyltransferase family 2 protein n=1 Tax=Sphingobacterium multivorum TaxID=28454 RepID=UPI003015ABCE
MDCPRPVAVSVVIPVYNVEKYLDETIQSVLDQELQDFEIILVNDGSSDSSAEICRKYASLDARIYFFDQENSGVSVARNNGLTHARGEYVYFLDSDDMIDPAFLIGAYKLAKQDDLDLVVVGEAYCYRAKRLTAVPTCGLFIKKALLDTYPDIRFPIGIQPCEDGLFSHRLFLMTDKIGFNPGAVYFYRQHENQNHVRINKETACILKQIPNWLELLKSFYDQYDFFGSKAIKLALFVEHEPFELRYLKMPFDDDEKAALLGLIQNFMRQYVEPYLSKDDIAILSVPFRYFMVAENHADFDHFYNTYRTNRAKKFKRALFWVKFIPISILRRKLRKDIRRKYVDI